MESLNIEVHPSIIIEEGFMERYFGRLDGDKLYTYSYVWPVDSFDVTHKAFDVESVAEVSARVRDAILRIESSDLHSERDGDIVVIVSHADTLQILQAYAAGLPNVGLFSQYRFGNGEVRELGRSQATLPPPKPLAVPKPGEYAP
jgi:broad specificity phosphatase PhoE